MPSTDITTCQVVEVVRTNLLQLGRGVEGDPIRIVEQFWSKDGVLLAQNDPCRDDAFLREMLRLALTWLESEVAREVWSGNDVLQRDIKHIRNVVGK